MDSPNAKHFIFIYGHSEPGKAAAGRDRVTLADGTFVLVGEGTEVEGYVPEEDADLLRAYQRTDGEPGNPEADVLLAEIERRGLDV